MNAQQVVNRMLEAEEDPQSFLDRALPGLHDPLNPDLDPANVDCLEVHEYREFTDEFGQEQCYLVTFEKDIPNSWGVAAHLIHPGGVDDAVGGGIMYDSPEKARAEAQYLSKQYGWPIQDFTR